MNKKDWKKSKTVWFNAMSLILLSLENNFPTLKPAIGDYWYGILFSLVCAINIALRFVSFTRIWNPNDKP